MSEYQANGLVVPDGFDAKSVDERAGLLLSSAPIPDEHREEKPMTVAHLCESYKVHLLTRYSAPHQARDLARKNRVVGDLLEYDSQTLIEAFGPKKLKKHRDRWVKAGNISRKCANRLTNET